MTPQQVSGIDAFFDEAYPVIDRWCAEAIQELGSGCREGCAACCYNVVSLSLLEAAVILRDPVGKAALETHREKVVEQANLFYARRPETRLEPWRRRRVPCVFLGACNRCLVYDRRPFNCRTHLAAKPCEPEQEGNYYIDPEAVTNLSLVLNDGAAEEIGLPFTIAPMPVALLMAEAMLAGGVDALKKAYDGTPLLDTVPALLFWSYLEL